MKEPGGKDSGEPFGSPRLIDVLNYRKVAIAVVSTYVGLEESFVDAVLADRMDNYLLAQEPEREIMKSERYDAYLTLLARETLVRYAATAAESLVSDPEGAHHPTPTLRHGDDLNAIARVHEICEMLESPDTDSDAERHLNEAKRHLCAYYAACAGHLVRDELLPVIISAAEELYRNGLLTAERTRVLVIEGENRG